MKINSFVKRGVAIAFAIIFSLSCFTAKAQKQYSQSVFSGTILVNTTTNFANPYYIDASQSQSISFQGQANAGAAYGSNVVYSLAPSCDGICMDTNPAHVIKVFAPYYPSTDTNSSGTQIDCAVTNVSCGAIQGYFLFQATADPSASPVATNSLKYSVKKQSP